MKRKGGLLASFWLSPFYLSLMFFLISLTIMLVIFQYYQPGPETVFGGLVGCAVGTRIPVMGFDCKTGAAIGSTGFTVLFGESADVGYHVGGAADIRATGVIAGNVLKYRISGEKLGERMGKHLYCRKSSDPPDYCGKYRDFPQNFKSAVETVIPDNRRYQASVLFRGVEVSATSDKTVFRRGPAVYRIPVEVPGGRTASFKLLVEGTRGGLIWR
ncbi:MAG: hypothetical protein SVQ76_01215 [Candidatus Nanohaloarchaea archaeon]|nr:hypothetical protein [Candidatus Nanohaloarchaea archaeon]